MTTPIVLVAKDIKDTQGHSYNGSVRLYRIVGTEDYIITSAVNNAWANETYIFPANAEGDVIDWGELPGSFQGDTDHDRALQNGGYVVVNDDGLIEGEATVIAGVLTT